MPSKSPHWTFRPENRDIIVRITEVFTDLKAKTIIIKVFVKCKILSTESILSTYTYTYAHTHTHTHTHTHAHTHMHATHTHARQPGPTHKTELCLFA